MTYSVPYSFVPGTKARAEEVNANFINVIDKINVANTRIDNCANLSLSNLNTTGQDIINNKADKTEIDGNWILVNKVLCSDKTIAPGATQTYSLESIFPTSDLYEIILDGQLYVASSGGTAYIYIKTQNFNQLSAFRIVNPNRYGTMQTLMVCNKNQTLSVINQSGSVGNSSYSLTIKAYRKVR